MNASERSAQLRAAGIPFAIATVTWSRGPSSGKAGSRAIILTDGTVEGWLGGACAQPSVVQQALAAIEDGQARLMVLGEHDPREGVVNVPMACASEGAMEVFVEPDVPVPDLHLIGASPMVSTLAGLASALGWRVRISDEPTVEAVGPASWVLVATQGHYDEPALETALATPAVYVGLVASSKRSTAVIQWLRDRGVSDSDLARVRAPAGLDLGSIEHEEIAVAVLAEMVALKASGGFRRAVEVATMEQAIDPVCQMTVDVATARFTTEHEGKTYYFCAPGCQKAFEADPDKYASDE